MDKENNRRENINKMHSDIRAGLCDINTNDNWLELYEEWNENEENQFTALLKVENSFDIKCVGDSFSYDFSDPNHMIDLDIMKMSVFLSEQLLMYLKHTITIVSVERNVEKRRGYIEQYFETIEKIVLSHELAGIIVTLNEVAEKQMVLQGKRAVDLYVCFFSLKEMLRMETSESIYLLYIYWVITKSTKDLKNLITALIGYIQTYFQEFDKDPEMHLYYSLEGMLTVKKIEIITHWLKMIAFHTNGIFEKYKSLKWMTSKDIMADDIILTNQISKYMMLQYKCLLPDDDKKTVIMKATAYQSYIIWIKTVDIMYIARNMCQSLYSLSEEALGKINASKWFFLELYDNMTKVADYYTGKVFFHKVYFEENHRYLDSEVMRILDEDAALISESIDDVLDFESAISSDDIESLMQAKKNYLDRLKKFTSKEQKRKLDELIERIVGKIKEAISKKDIYDEMYSAVSEDFDEYAVVLMKHPKIFSTLVSAEYLYHQYVDGKQPNFHFDYSCISIMYYMALEDFINRLVYIPYEKNVLSHIDTKYTKDNNWKKTDALLFVSKFNSFWDITHRKWKKTCEIGVLGYLLEGVFSELEFKQYIEKTYENVNLTRLVMFGQNLKKVAPRRNDAAHGGNYLSYDDVCMDKGNVYNSINEYRGLILELLEVLFKKNVVHTSGFSM